MSLDIFLLKIDAYRIHFDKYNYILFFNKK